MNVPTQAVRLRSPDSPVLVAPWAILRAVPGMLACAAGAGRPLEPVNRTTSRPNTSLASPFPAMPTVFYLRHVPDRLDRYLERVGRVTGPAAATEGPNAARRDSHVGLHQAPRDTLSLTSNRP